MSKFGLGDTLRRRAVHFVTRKLASWGTQGIYGAAWSPDSRSLVYSDAGQLYLFDVAEGGFQHLKSRCDFAISPTFSPDGRTLAYYAGTLQGAILHLEISLHHLVTGKQRTIPTYRLELPANPGALFYFQMGFTLSWHPDGYRLACTRLQLEEEDNYSVEIVDTADGYTVSLQSPSQKQRYPVWSPDGKYLAYAVETKVDVVGYEVSPLDLYVTDDEGKHPRKLWDSRAQAKIWPFGESLWKTDSSGLIVFTVDPQTGEEINARLWKPNGPSLNFAPLEGVPHTVFNLPTGIVSVSPDLQGAVYLDEDQKTLLYNPAPFNTPRVLDVLPTNIVESAPTQPLVAPDGKTVAVLPVLIPESKHAALHLYDVESGRKSVYPLPH